MHQIRGNSKGCLKKHCIRVIIQNVIPLHTRPTLHVGTPAPRLVIAVYYKVRLTPRLRCALVCFVLTLCIGYTNSSLLYPRNSVYFYLYPLWKIANTNSCPCRVRWIKESFIYAVHFRKAFNICHVYCSLY